MKLLVRIPVLCMLLIGFFSVKAQNPSPPKTQVVLANEEQQFTFPMDVMNVIDSKCMGCHKPEARNEKARKAMQWVALQTLDSDSLVSSLTKMNEILTEGKMPPARTLERFPERKLTEEETALLQNWIAKKMETLKKLDE